MEAPVFEEVDFPSERALEEEGSDGSREDLELLMEVSIGSGLNRLGGGAEVAMVRLGREYGKGVSHSTEHP